VLNVVFGHLLCTKVATKLNYSKMSVNYAINVVSSNYQIESGE